jgi:IclR family acetate operon transcriptional repressor
MVTRTSPAAAESIALRAFAALEQVVNAAGPMTLDELTTALQLPKPTVFRILNMLKDADLLRRDLTSKRYTVGPRLSSFALDLWRSDMLRVPWRRALEEAVDQIEESCNLTVLDNDEVLYLDRVESSHPLRLHLDVGTRVPLHCTASGKLFLSQMDPDAVRHVLGPEPYERFTPHTLTSFRELHADLLKVRRSGVGTHDCERFDDSVAIAVPVRGQDGSVVAAVAMHAPSSRASIRSCLAFVPALQRAAAVIAETVALGPLRPAPAPAAVHAPAAPAPPGRRRR